MRRRCGIGARAAPPAALVEALVVWMVGWWIVSHRLSLLMQAQGVPMGTFEAFEINLATLFYALFLPGGNLTGIAVRLYRLSRGGGRYATGLLAMASDRLAATAAVSLIGLMCWALDPRDKPRAALAVLVVSAGMVIAAIAPFAVSELLRRLAALHRAAVFKDGGTFLEQEFHGACVGSPMAGAGR